jgi:hypothetical protein
LVHPAQQGFEAIEPVAPDGAVMTHPVHQRRKALVPRAVMGFASRTSVVHEPRRFQPRKCFETAGCETRARSVSARTVSSPSRQSRSKSARRVGSASVSARR